MRRTLSQATLPVASLLITLTMSSAYGVVLDDDRLALPDGRAGAAYEYRIQTEGGLPPLKWRLVRGELPPGLDLLPSGVLRGTPTTARREPYIFEIEVSDSSQPSQTFSQQFVLLILAAPLRIISHNTTLRIVPSAENRVMPPPAPTPEAAAHPREANQPVPSAAESSSAPGDRNDPSNNADKMVSVSGRISLASQSNLPHESPLRGKTNLQIESLRQTTFASATEYRKLNPTERKQMLFIEDHLPNLLVEARKSDGTLAATALTDQHGNYGFTLPAGQSYTISTEADDHSTRRTALVSKNTTLNLQIEDRPVSLLTRAVVGLSQSGASSAKSDQNYFFDLFISKSLPFPQRIDPDFGERWRTWGDIRIASVPQQIKTPVGQFDIVKGVADIPVSEIAQALEFLAGIDVRVLGNAALLPSFDRQTKQKFSLSLVAGFGTTTPVNPADSVKVFKVSPGAPGLPLETMGKEFVAFVPSDRDRFFRQYYAGVRISTFFFNKHNIPLQRFPGILDVMYGQNEYITGGRLHGGVFRLDGLFPLPYEGMKYINLFGTALLRPGRSRISPPLILEPAPSGTAVPAPNVAMVATPQINRDYYRVGVGIDFMSLIQSLKNLNKK